MHVSFLRTRILYFFIMIEISGEGAVEHSPVCTGIFALHPAPYFLPI